MSLQLQTYAAYLVISLLTTISVGRTLFHHGRPFLIDVFRGNAALADAVNRLLLVGFYLVNFAFVLGNLSAVGTVSNPREALHLLSSKVGIVLLVTGIMHFGNLSGFTALCVHYKHAGRRAG